MNKKIFLSVVVAIVAFTGSAVAQKGKPIFGGNVIIGIPTGDFRTDYKGVTGIEGLAGFGVAQNVYVTGTLGFQSYSPDPNSFDGTYYGKITSIPLKAGLRIYPTNNFFLTGNAGIALLKDQTIDARESRFAYDIGAGFSFNIFHASVHYDGWQTKNTSGGSNSVVAKLGIAIR
ncbi:hypothetical protein ESA94_07105 [Lacibacter luteus]|uniref:Outer membrane protein beta-barrel domain-containing protein n=1 Tax=Lacibacter luteus TaxID=2508719 RepID=A0A4Q1CNQ0_9BACT|nr:hypothetical protein [Lacibacter luteus]RXK62758.1 hypothetical protein ESA94_07105 [Lacibacter luteus]